MKVGQGSNFEIKANLQKKTLLEERERFNASKELFVERRTNFDAKRDKYKESGDLGLLTEPEREVFETKIKDLDSKIKDLNSKIAKEKDPSKILDLKEERLELKGKKQDLRELRFDLKVKNGKTDAKQNIFAEQNNTTNVVPKNADQAQNSPFTQEQAQTVPQYFDIDGNGSITDGELILQNGANKFVFSLQTLQNQEVKDQLLDGLNTVEQQFAAALADGNPDNDAAAIAQYQAQMTEFSGALLDAAIQENPNADPQLLQQTIGAQLNEVNVGSELMCIEQQGALLNQQYQAALADGDPNNDAAATAQYQAQIAELSGIRGGLLANLTLAQGAAPAQAAAENQYVDIDGNGSVTDGEKVLQDGSNKFYSNILNIQDQATREQLVNGLNAIEQQYLAALADGNPDNNAAAAAQYQAQMAQLSAGLTEAIAKENPNVDPQIIQQALNSQLGEVTAGAELLQLDSQETVINQQYQAAIADGDKNNDAIAAQQLIIQMQQLNGVKNDIKSKLPYVNLQ